MVFNFITEPEYEFSKKLRDVDCVEKATGEFSCEVNDQTAKVKWYFRAEGAEDKVRTMT